MVARVSKVIGGGIRLMASLLLVASAPIAWQYSTRAGAPFSDPETAYQRYPASAQAATQAFLNRLRQDPTFVPSERDMLNIRLGLLARPLSPILLSFVAIRYETQGRTDKADRAMVLADRVSRRDSISQVWLIERSVSKGDITTAMRHYHAAMSVNPDIMPSLIPIVAGALVYPEVRVAVRPYIVSHASWIPALLSKAVEVSASQDLADLVVPVATSMTSEKYGYPKSQIIAALLVDGKSDLAWQLAARMMPGLKPLEFSSLAFMPATVDPRMGTLAWNFPQSGQISSAPPLDGVLTVTVSPLANGVVAVRDIPMVPGVPYQFLQTVKYEAGTPRARLVWTADCVKRAGLVRIWNQAIPDQAEISVLRSLISAPADCHLLRMKASVHGAEGQVSSQIAISDLRFEGVVARRTTSN